MLTPQRFCMRILLYMALAPWSITPLLAQEHPQEHPKEMTQDPVKLAPDKCKVLLENDRVRVLDIRLKPGEKLGMHSHPAAVTYFLNDGKGKTSYPDGRTNALEVKAGQTAWSEAVTHANENVGTTELRVLVVEMKEAPKPEPKK
jgi:quercetin dioxygenase-like cupin family protein